MSEHIELGKIKKAEFGYGGYQDAMICFTIDIGGKSWGSTKTYECGWGHVSEEDLKRPSSTYKWTHESRINQIGTQAWEVFKLMQEAGARSLKELEGKPIRAIFDGPCGRLQKIEILKECL